MAYGLYVLAGETLSATPWLGWRRARGGGCGKLWLQLERELRNAFAEHLAGQLVPFTGGHFRRFLPGLSHDAAETPQPVHAVGLHGHLRRADPDHAVLHGQGLEIVQRARLVAARASRDRETAGHLVAPGAAVPTPARGVGKGLELRRRAAHVGGAAKNDGVAGIQLGEHGFVGVTPLDDVVAVDGEELGLDAADGGGALVDGFRQFGRVTAAGEINDRYSRHMVCFGWFMVNGGFCTITHLGGHLPLAPGFSPVSEAKPPSKPFPTAFFPPS